MNNSAADAIEARLQQIEQWSTKRDAAVTGVYGSLFIAGFALLVLFPFPLSRVGSVVMILGFIYMVWRCKAAPRPDARGGLADKLFLVEKQIEFAQSVLYNIPFFVGANLFWMGLPGTGTALQKAVQDFVFLGGTLLVLTASYAFNQRLIRKRLIPLRNELRRLIESESEAG
jgi:hypothetical protein